MFAVNTRQSTVKSRPQGPGKQALKTLFRPGPARILLKFGYSGLTVAGLTDGCWDL